jgi:acetyl esterase/lipase
MGGWQQKIRQGCEAIVTKFAVDISRVILGGPSAGGYHSLILGLEHFIPAFGLLLSFQVYPRDSDSVVFIQSAERSLKLAMLCEENDWAIQQQKKLGHLLDKYGIQNRFVVFPEEGHSFPENCSYYLVALHTYLVENAEQN